MPDTLYSTKVTATGGRNGSIQRRRQWYKASTL
jgi:hypothetical protein